MLGFIGCARPAVPPRSAAQARPRCYVNVAEVAQHHPLWQTTLRADPSPEPSALTLPPPAPLEVRAVSRLSPLQGNCSCRFLGTTTDDNTPHPTSPARGEESVNFLPLAGGVGGGDYFQGGEPSARSSASEERRRRSQQQELRSVHEFEAALRQMVMQHVEAEVKQRLAQAREVEEAQVVRQGEAISQKLREEFEGWREQQRRELARAVQQRRVRLTIPDLPSDVRQSLQAEIDILEQEVEARRQRKQQDIQEQIAAERRRLTADMEQRLKRLERSLRDERTSVPSLAEHRERLAQDLAPGVEMQSAAASVDDRQQETGVLDEGFRVSGFALSHSQSITHALPFRAPRREAREAMNQLRAYLLRDTARRVRQWARERGWQLVTRPDAPGVLDKTQACIRLLRAEARQMTGGKS